MQPLTKKVKQVERKPMTWLEKLYLPAIFKGMAITFSHIFKKTPTVSYPEEKRAFAKVFRGFTSFKQG
jgi:NADH-quinone oxidoreductase subunit I